MLDHIRPLVLATLRNRKGVTAAEYAVLAVGIVIAVSAAAVTLGTTISSKFASIFG
ncbi:Flp family type IVb pilin [Pararoseomonas indoligenes]|uniref:Flp family type IVb pilin n=1 Tax=Roseomonas indoligenes TaxID=2820811 RepID=A0A940N292_9PROT|nr:Flp family type IVb pilin [Pararoseomonas indoligenes]MBP0493880.1 Flp family type IVb pilin [Pararoseomonas indoligenes]